MTTQHPITPPPELLGKWEEDWHHAKVKDTDLEDHIAIQAARWGADQELDACCELLSKRVPFPPTAANIRAARRPKPPSLKELAVAALERQAIRSVPSLKGTEDCDTIRRALEALPND